MKHILILSTRYKRRSGASHNNAEQVAEHLARSLDGKDRAATSCLIEDLLFVISGSSTQILLPTGEDIASFDLVYVKFWGALHDIVSAIGIHLDTSNTVFICSEITQFRLEDKVSEGFLMATNGLRYPNSFFSISQARMLEAAIDTWGYPFVLKSIDGQKGEHNYRISSKEDVKNAIKASDDSHTWLLAQQLIPNTEDYRLLCFGNEPQIVIKRIGNKQKTHLNNTSQGARAEQVDKDTLPQKVLDDASRICRLAKREIAGVDVMKHSVTGVYYFLEINYSPQLTTGTFLDAKKQAFSDYVKQVIELPPGDTDAQHQRTELSVIGVSALVNLTSYKAIKRIPARIDSGARTSSLWASDIKVKDDTISFAFFGPGSPYYTGKRVTVPLVGKRIVTSSMGMGQERYVVKLKVGIAGKKMNAKFTLADRSRQVYPILIGRNTLRGTFLVDSSNPGEAARYKDPAEENEFSESEAV